MSRDGQQAGKVPLLLMLTGTGLGGLAVVATLALWFHYGSEVFFEMLRAGLAACF